MATTLAQLNSKIVVDGVQEAIRGLQQVADAFDSAGTGATQAKKPIDDIVAGLAKFGIIKTAATSLLDLGKATVQNYSDNERLGASLASLVAKEDLHFGRAQNMTQALAGASAKSQELLAWTQKLAIESPFSQQGVAQAFKMAQAYGFVSETANKADVDAKRLTQALIDFASGSGQSEDTMSRIALALGQIQAKGKLAGQEMMQLTETGLNVRQILADSFKKSTTEIVAMQEKGLIPADKAIKAIVESLEHDFGGAAKRQAGTWAGLLNSLSDIKDVGLREFFTGTFQAIQPMVNTFVDTLSKPEVLQNIRAWGQGLGDIAKTGAGAFQVLISNIQTLTPIIVGAGAAWVGLTIAQNANTISKAANAVATIAVSTAESAQLIIMELQTNGLRAATASTWQLIGAQGRLIVTLGAVAIAAAAVTAAYMKWREVQDQIAQGVQDTLGKTRGWNESATALDAYNKAGANSQAITKHQADSLAQMRAEQEQAIKAYADMEIAGKRAFQSDESFEAQKQRARDAINARSTALQRATVALNSMIGYEDLEAQRLQRVTQLRYNETHQVEIFTDKIQQLTKVTQDSANKSQADALAKEAQKTQTELLQAKTKSLGDEYLRLHPNITQAGVASAFAAGKINESVATYIAMTLKIAQARDELAKLQKQAGVDAARTPVGGGIQGGADRALGREGNFDNSSDVKAATALLAARTKATKDLHDAERNRILQTGTAAEKEKLFNNELKQAIALYGKNSAEAVNAKTALDAYHQSIQKQSGGAAAKDAKAEQDLLLAQQSDAISRLQTKHDLLVEHLSHLKKNSADYKETLAQILTLEEQIAVAKEKQAISTVDMAMAVVKDREARRQEARELAGLQNVVGGAGFSAEQKAAASDRIQEIQLGQQKRALELQAQSRQTGVPVNGASAAAASQVYTGTAGATAQNGTPATSSTASVAAREPLPPSIAPANVSVGPPQIVVNLTLAIDAQGRPVIRQADPGITLNVLYDSQVQALGSGAR